MDFEKEAREFAEQTRDAAFDCDECQSASCAHARENRAWLMARLTSALRAAEAAGYARGRDAAARYIDGIALACGREDEPVKVRRAHFHEWAEAIRALRPDAGTK